MACHALTGDMDYLLHVFVEDLEHFSRFLLDHLLRDSVVADVNSSFVLRTVKQERALPLRHLIEPSRRNHPAPVAQRRNRPHTPA